MDCDLLERTSVAPSIPYDVFYALPTMYLMNDRSVATRVNYVVPYSSLGHRLERSRLHSYTPSCSSIRASTRATQSVPKLAASTRAIWDYTLLSEALYLQYPHSISNQTDPQTHTLTPSNSPPNRPQTSSPHSPRSNPHFPSPPFQA